MLLELRVALRRLLRRPFSSLALIALIGAAVGVNSAAFGQLNALVLADLPFSEPEQLVRIWGGARDQVAGSMIPQNYDLVANSQVNIFSATAAYRHSEARVGDSLNAPRYDVAHVTPSFFEVFRVALGCVSIEQVRDAVAVGERLIVVRESFAARQWPDYRCGDVRFISIDGVAYRLAGLLPDGFVFPEPTISIYIPFRPQEERGATGRVVSMRVQPVMVVARLLRGTGLQKATAELRNHVKLSDGAELQLLSLKEEQTRHISDSVLLLQLLAIFVMLVTFVNVSQILLAQASQRTVEAAIKTGLGATAWRTHQGTFLESVVLAVGGGACGTAFHFLIRKLLVVYGPASSARFSGSEGFPVVAAGALVALLCGILPGILVLLRTKYSGASLQAWASGSPERVGVRRSQLRFSQAMLVGQALATTAGVVVGTLLVKSTVNLLSVDIGFQPARIFSSTLHAASDDADQTSRELQRVAEMGSASGFQLAIASSIPMTITTSVSVRLPGVTQPVVTQRVFVTADYFRLLSIPTLAGRTFRAGDTQSAEAVAVVSDDFAKRFIAANTVGNTLMVGSQARTIVGVVGNVRSRGVRQTTSPTIYIPLPQATVGLMAGRGQALRRAELLFRLQSDLATTERDISALISRSSSILSVSPVRPLSAPVERDTRSTRFLTGVVGVFAGLTLILGAVATSVAAYQYFSLRRNEFAVKLALGATPRLARLLVVRVALTPAFLGILLGLPVGYWIASLLASHLFGISASAWSAYLIAAAAVLAGCVIAILPPAYRAGQINPAEALRAL